jgi:hypothetical protein
MNDKIRKNIHVVPISAINGLIISLLSKYKCAAMIRMDTIKNTKKIKDKINIILASLRYMM